MKELFIPNKLNKGDCVAFISISGGRAGDSDMLPRYLIGKERFEKEFGVKVIETPNALKGSKYLYEHPELRASDLMWALSNKDIKGIICIMGGDDSYRVLPYIDINVIRDNPKVFMGYSDIATWVSVFMKAGVRSYYGPNVLTPIAQIGSMDDYTKESIYRTLFSDSIIGEIKPSTKTTPIEWRNINKEEIVWTMNNGYKLLQGSGVINGYLLPVCGGPLWQIMGTEYYPSKEDFKDSIIALEHDNIYNSKLAGLHQLRAFAASGMFDNCKALLTGPLNHDAEETLLKVINDEVHRNDLVIIENVDFIHRTPMTILPCMALTEIDTNNLKIKIKEKGTR